jgi:hypothetical protein
VRALPLLFFLTACGASASSLREAREASYDAPFATVWNVVVDEIHKKYPVVVIEDPTTGNLLTNWKLVQRLDLNGAQEVPGMTGTAQEQKQQQEQTQAQRNAGGIQSRCPQASLVFRVKVRIKGPPWRIDLDGEAAECQPDLAVLTPFRHGQPDEPQWVPGRIESLTLDIHERLKQYAIKAKVVSVPRSAITEKVQDTTPWANLPDRAAVSLVGQVHEAAMVRDAPALRKTMSEDFEWTQGADGSAETALAMFSADPTKMKQLALTIEGGCAADKASGDVVCAPEETDMEARFRKVDGAWKFVHFARR